MLKLQLTNKQKIISQYIYISNFYFHKFSLTCFSEEVPHLKEFKNYCRDSLQHNNPTKRPNLSEVLLHSFFNHEFITIYKFLNFLPLKSDEEKNEFFSIILDNLKCYDEETVAKQFGGLLLSRLTMLDPTAREDVIPFILKPKNGKLYNITLTLKEHFHVRFISTCIICIL